MACEVALVIRGIGVEQAFAKGRVEVFPCHRARLIRSDPAGGLTSQDLCVDDFPKGKFTCAERFDCQLQLSPGRRL